MVKKVELFNADFRNALSDFRNVILNEYENYEIFRKRNPNSKVPQQKYIKSLSSIINKKTIKELKDQDAIGQLDRSANPTLKKYLGITNSGTINDHGRIKQMVDVFERITKENISNINWSLKVRVKPKDKNIIYMIDSGQTAGYTRERNMYNYVWYKPEIFMPWTKFTNKERKNMKKHIDVLSIANVAKFYTERTPNKEVLRLESRIKGRKSLAEKIINEYLLQKDTSKAKLPTDLLGVKIICSPELLYSLARTITKNKKLIKSITPSYQGPIYYLVDTHGAYSRLKNLEALEKITNEAININKKYAEVYNHKKLSEKDKVEYEKQKDIDKKKLFISVKSFIETYGAPPIKEAIQTFEWKELDDNSYLVGHDAKYYFERRDKILSARKKVGLDKFTDYIEEMMFFLLEPRI